jgi:ABC-type multidrug transport system fused ATPase/permease subunit
MFLCFSAAGGTFTPATVLSSIALLELIRWPLLLLPMSLSWSLDAWISLGRFANLFEAEEIQDMGNNDENPNGTKGIEIKEGTVLEWDAVPSVETVEDLMKQNKPANKGFLWRSTIGRTKKGGDNGMKGAIDAAAQAVPLDSMASDAEAAKFSVTLPSLTLAPGTLTAIVGPVGSGKSTLLAGIIGDVKIISGGIVAPGAVAFCSQTPWIQSASIRENVLFGMEYDAERFAEVLRVCSLERDLAVFPDGDHTAVGEKGLSLSGGQKARLALARAICESEKSNWFNSNHANSSPDHFRPKFGHLHLRRHSFGSR